jgi:hypothetical protein
VIQLLTLGISLICSDKVKSEKSISDEATKNLIAQPLRAPKKKKAKTAAPAETKA